ncbi:MAG: DNA-3-methyladenine glycosylase [Cyclobacteriaceae bacterium]|nr:DNA-3-methyladenine glycosylase [Cyclobacteriaceae bacterium]
MLNRDFYIHDDVVKISRNLLGKVLYTFADQQVTAGKIVETEAYCGMSDKASHAYPNRKTRRNQIMFEEGGVAYVYLIYGIHCLFNVVTGSKGIPNAVLIRALEPLVGLDVMCHRRQKTQSFKITSGPGSLSSAMGINLSLYGSSLQSDKVWIEDQGEDIPENKIISTTRIGVEHAGDDALLPWRFYILDNPWISKKR